MFESTLWLSSVNGSLLDVVSPTAGELIHPSDFYSRRSGELRVEADEMAARYSKHTQILVFLGLLACVALYQSLVAKRWPLWTVGGLVPVAAWVVRRRHQCHLRSVEICGLIDYYGKGSARLARKWDELEEGKKFLEQDHLYSTDLDLFGEGSLYQLLCSARTHIARETLARWMKSPAKREEILERQEAISELRPRRDLPESVVTAGRMQVSDFRPEFLKSWVVESSPFPLWAPALALLLALAVIIQPVLYWSGFLALHTLWAVLVKLLFIEAVFAAILRSRVKSVLEPLDTLSIELPTMRELLRIMERERFTSAKLKAIGKRLGSNGRPPSRQIQRLLRLILLVKQRQNEWFAYPSYCLLWGTQFAMAIERWRRRHGEDCLSGWRPSESSKR